VTNTGENNKIRCPLGAPRLHLRPLPQFHTVTSSIDIAYHLLMLHYSTPSVSKYLLLLTFFYNFDHSSYSNNCANTIYFCLLYVLMLYVI
jgi:hypothetical protein